MIRDAQMGYSEGTLYQNDQFRGTRDIVSGGSQLVITDL